MLWRGAVIVGVLSIPGAALACPEGPDAARLGVAVSYEDGTVSTYRRGVDGIVNEVTLFDSVAGEGYGVVAYQGFYMLEEYDLVGGAKDQAGLERQTFPQGLKSLPAPEPGLQWTGAAQVAFGAEPAIPREVRLSIGQPERVVYGACAYDSWPAILRHRDATEDYSLGFDYLPALGIAVLRSFTDAGTPAESYLPVGIAAAP